VGPEERLVGHAWSVIAMFVAGVVGFLGWLIWQVVFLDGIVVN
jgi:hypothetical protein